MRRPDPPATWPTPRRAARWTDEDMEFAAAHLTRWTRAQIARGLGRSPRAVEQWQQRSHQWATTQTLLTASEYARQVGRTPQTIAAQCRRGTLPARRVPGGRWWLIAPSARRNRRCPSTAQPS